MTPLKISLIKTILTTAALAFAMVTSAHDHQPADGMKVSIQLWSVKEDLKADFKGTIKQIADMGFHGVELAGEYGEFKNDPEGLTAFIKSHGMEISGTHTGFDALSDDKFEQTMSFFQRAGVPTVIIAWDDRAFNANTVWQTIADLNRLQSKVESYGMFFGYHNHAEEFNSYKDVTLWDHIARSTPDSFVMQLDAGWAQYMGKNPAEYVRKYPGRALSIHYKAAENDTENGKLPIIGQDSLDWPALIKASDEIGGTNWLVLEQEAYPNNLTPLQTVAMSKKALDKYLHDYRN